MKLNTSKSSKSSGAESRTKSADTSSSSIAESGGAAAAAASPGGYDEYQVEDHVSIYWQLGYVLLHFDVVQYYHMNF